MPSHSDQGGDEGYRLGDRLVHEYRFDISLDVGFLASTQAEAAEKRAKMTREAAEWIFEREDVTFVEADHG